MYIISLLYYFLVLKLIVFKIHDAHSILSLKISQGNGCCEHLLSVEHLCVEHLSVEHLSIEHLSVEHLNVEHLSVEHLSVEHCSVEHLSVEHLSNSD